MLGAAGLSYKAYQMQTGSDLFSKRREVLKVERIDDKLNAYKTSFIGEIYGPAAAKGFTASQKMFKDQCNQGGAGNIQGPGKPLLSPQAVASVAKQIASERKKIQQKHAAAKALRETYVNKMLNSQVVPDSSKEEGALLNQQLKEGVAQAKLQEEVRQAHLEMLAANLDLEMSVMKLLVDGLDADLRERFLQADKDSALARVLHSLKNSLLGLVSEDVNVSTLLLSTRWMSLLQAMGLPRGDPEPALQLRPSSCSRICCPCRCLSHLSLSSYLPNPRPLTPLLTPLLQSSCWSSRETFSPRRCSGCVRRLQDCC